MRWLSPMQVSEMLACTRNDAMRIMKLAGALGSGLASTIEEERLQAYLDSCPDYAETLAKRRAHTGTIYFISCRDTIKIGYTAGETAEDRLLSLQIGNPYKLTVVATMPGKPSDERKLHARFKSHRLIGEWFTAVPELLAFIEEIKRK